MPSPTTIELREANPKALLWLLVGHGVLAIAGCLAIIVLLKASFGENVAIGAAMGWMVLISIGGFLFWRKFASFVVTWAYTLEGVERRAPDVPVELFAWPTIVEAYTGVTKVDTMERNYLGFKLDTGRVVELGYAGIDVDKDAELARFAGLVIGEVERRQRAGATRADVQTDAAT